MRNVVRDPMLTECTYKMVRASEMLWNFGCPNYEAYVAEWINRSLYQDKMPDFSEFDNPEVSYCSCTEDSCAWKGHDIIEKLKKIGMWDKMAAILSPDKKRLSARFLSDGGIEISGFGKYPCLAGVGYLDDDLESNLKKVFPNGFVVYADHDNEYMMVLPDGSYQLLEMKKED